MKNSQEQREAMLKEARSYHSGKEAPVIHPRYRALYKELYPTKEEKSKSTLGTRILICLILFALFAAIDQGHITETPVSSTQIIHEIEAPLHLTMF